MRKPRRIILPLTLCVSTFLAPKAEAQVVEAVGSLASAAWSFAGPLLWEGGKAAAGVLGTVLMQEAVDWFKGPQGTLTDSKGLDTRFEQLQNELNNANQRQLANAVQQFRTEITPGMSYAEYTQKVFATVQKLEQRVGALEAENKELRKLLEQLTARVGNLEGQNLIAENELRDPDQLVRCQAALQQARAHVQRGEYAPAVAELTQALQPVFAVSKTFLDKEVAADARDTMGHILMARGNAYRAIRMSELALVDYTSASLLFSSANARAQCFEIRGDLLLGQKQAESAVEDYSRALKFTPDSRSLYNKRSEAYRALGDARNADIDTRTARTLNDR